VGTEHLLLGLIAEQKGIAAQVLADRGITLDNAAAEVVRILGTEMPTGQPARTALSADVPLGFQQSIGMGQTIRKTVGYRIEPPTELLVKLVGGAEAVATEYFSAYANPVHAAIALLRRGEGFAVAILDRLGCDREKALRALDDVARKGEQTASAEKGAALDENLAEFLREMYQPWKMGLGTLDLLLFLIGKSSDVAAVFADQGIKAGRILEEGRRFSG
jgi:ATP-dependent Clp protease ATP-binding subunit ClpA